MITKRRLLIRGFTLVEIMIVILILGMLIAIMVPNFMKSRDTSSSRTCQSNLHKIEGAKELWALENKKGQGAATDMINLAPYMKYGPTCPMGGTYTTQPMGTPPTCSIGGNHSL